METLWWTVVVVVWLAGSFYFIHHKMQRALRENEPAALRSIYNLAELSNIRLFAALFIVFALALYSASTQPELKHSIFAKILELLAGSFLTTGIFSILLGFSDFINFVSKKLTDIVLNEEYLRSIGIEKMLRLKHAIAEQMFGEAATRNPSSLYQFMDRRIDRVFKESYRTEFHNEYIYRKTNDDAYWLMENHTSYHCCKSKFDNKKITIPFHTSWELPIGTGLTAKDIVKLFEVHIDSAKYVLYISKDQNNVDILKLKLVEDDVKGQFQEEVASVHTIMKKVDKTEFKTDFCIEIPDELFMNKESVLVDITRQQLIAKDDNVIFLTMAYPTKDVYLSCAIYGDDYKMNCYAFGFEDQSHIKRTGISSALIDMKEWLLPGHGAVITWMKIQEGLEPDLEAADIGQLSGSDMNKSVA